jgi:hypothetical protein
MEPATYFWIKSQKIKRNNSFNGSGPDETGPARIL